MAAKITYTATTPEGQELSTTSTRTNIKWATLAKFEGDTEWNHFGWSSSATLKGAMAAGRSTNPYAARYSAVPAIALEA